MKYDDKPLVTEHLANEQTLLAWLRTAVQVMAFGFVAVKFSLFASQVVGIILVGSGALMTLLSYLRYHKTVRLLRNGKYQYSSFLLTITATAMLVVSVVLMVYLIEAYLKTGSTDGNPSKEKRQSDRVSSHFY